jgi:putative CocE/NonD family hydrolase
MRLLLGGIIASAAIAMVAAFLLYSWRGPITPVSAFGRYHGYADAGYDGTDRVSAYLTLRDGTRLAYDLILPTKKGATARERLPVLFKYTPYLRTWTIFDEHGKNLIADFVALSWQEKAFLRLRYWLAEDGRLFDPLWRTKWLETMIKHGYAVIVVERPGTGASFGVMDASFEANAREIDQILDWIAAQPWSDGNIGMYGDSFQAMVQFVAAATGNPHLKAIFPASSPIELYDSIEYRGGVYNKAFAAFFAGAAAHLERLATPVDDDKDRSLLAQARAERQRATMGEQLDLSSQRYAFRDSLTPDGKKPWQGVALYPFIERINRAGVPIYMTTGWYDIFAGDRAPRRREEEVLM